MAAVRSPYRRNTPYHEEATAIVASGDRRTPQRRLARGPRGNTSRGVEEGAEHRSHVDKREGYSLDQEEEVHMSMITIARGSLSGGWELSRRAAARLAAAGRVRREAIKGSQPSAGGGHDGTV
jgi:hypothetical protein